MSAAPSVVIPAARATGLAAVNPVARLAAALVLTLVLVLSLDVVSAGAALLLELLLLPFAGLRPRAFLLRSIPIWVAAPSAGLTILLYGRTSGDVYAQFLLVVVSEGSVLLAVATTLRVLAIGVASLVLFSNVDPTDLADGLAQVGRLPSRFVLGALAGVRLVGLLLDDWRSLELARRARGVADRGRIRRFAGQAFALLVLSIRRGSKLATAMEARGFGGATARTWARPSVVGRREAIVVSVAVLVAVSSVAAAVAAGTWNFVAA
ncbi:energy-coupling factor transporter transmembrane component T family protein [Clavibacter michiganensis]|uniref:ABC transporter n=1 Tax=Clavibacter michiganensis subsp. insidiosus TaxID=33014 RepID=A0A0D5CGQ0_9MICO|nr:energy-coupling factor transporter transmembrane component T [Clavibacter michiganensis]AJW78791.1 ABC transporter [Clavibacter michiganensis subsp. insidiosus]AWF98548.1 ABC transporter [Clavibacter michiganensis subsp. insidiosus]AWG01250.1 ABC transporter [Clavibacter michiganensis subsp. insidiosus]OQJ60201.1 ABC transporter [Clavibacter michiganensis subsp. insidiosus]RII88179.1 energy-coupling factor transporter transmembrane protein EcfT [Clavibacter michiganensis subsp. insidiosus]